MTISKEKLIALSLTMALVATAGCARGPTRVEQDYGNSVRAMKRAQTQDLMKVMAPDTTPVETTDGQRMENVLDSYRSTKSDPSATTSRPLILGVDSD